MRDAEKTIGNMLDKHKVVYVSSMDEDGFPTTKAMFSPRFRKGIKELYFTTNTSSLRVQHFLNNPKACVYICDQRFYHGIMLRGNMEVLFDDEHRELLWKQGDTMYYPQGIHDPDYCVLKFTTIDGRRYHQLKKESFTIE